MAFLLPRSMFIHIPKTGGQWVVSALERARVPVQALGVVHTSPDELGDSGGPPDRPFLFAMVRHPLSWYRSMWAHQTDDDWEPIDAVDWFTPRWLEFWSGFTRNCASRDFREFVRRCTEHYPAGLVSTLYGAYTQGCAFVGHQEQLVEDLVRALKTAGENFDEVRLRDAPARNVRGGRRHRHGQSIYTPELIDRVMQVESGAIERFGYEAIPADILASLGN